MIPNVLFMWFASQPLTLNHHCFSSRKFSLQQGIESYKVAHFSSFLLKNYTKSAFVSWVKSHHRWLHGTRSSIGLFIRSQRGHRHIACFQKSLQNPTFTLKTVTFHRFCLWTQENTSYKCIHFPMINIPI